MLEYEKREEAESFSEATRFYLKTPLVIDGEEVESIVLARGSGFGEKPTGIFIDDELFLEEKTLRGAVAHLVIASENMELQAVEKE